MLLQLNVYEWKRQNDNAKEIMSPIDTQTTTECMFVFNSPPIYMPGSVPAKLLTSIVWRKGKKSAQGAMTLVHCQPRVSLGSKEHFGSSFRASDKVKASKGTLSFQSAFTMKALYRYGCTKVTHYAGYFAYHR